MPYGDSDRYRLEAEECQELAARAIHPVDKEEWLRLAAEWIKLAQEAEGRRRNF